MIGVKQTRKNNKVEVLPSKNNQIRHVGKGIIEAYQSCPLRNILNIKLYNVHSNLNDLGDEREMGEIAQIESFDNGEIDPSKN